MNTDKLPKAEEVLKLELNIDRLTPLQYSGIIRAMQEYTRQVLDVVAEEAKVNKHSHTGEILSQFEWRDKPLFAPNDNIYKVDKSSILSFKDKLK